MLTYFFRISGGKLEFENVNFCYQPEKAILKNVSFVVEPGQTVALVNYVFCHVIDNFNRIFGNFFELY